MHSVSNIFHSRSSVIDSRPAKENGSNGDKIRAYKWTCVDKPGVMLSIHKDALKIDSSYQRELNAKKTLEIASEWSWTACGALIVAARGNDFFVVDGQHRLEAALKRSDIAELPCIVFETADVKAEAVGFLRSNTNRKPIGSIARHKAAIVADDALSKIVQSEIADAGLEITACAKRSPQIKCIGVCSTLAKQNIEAFRYALRTSASLSVSSNLPVNEKVLLGLFYIALNVTDALSDKRMHRRLLDIGMERLLNGAHRAAVFHARGSSKVFAEGILTEVNKGLRDKFKMLSSDAE